MSITDLDTTPDPIAGQTAAPPRVLPPSDAPVAPTPVGPAVPDVAPPPEVAPVDAEEEATLETPDAPATPVSVTTGEPTTPITGSAGVPVKPTPPTPPVVAPPLPAYHLELTRPDESESAVEERFIAQRTEADDDAFFNKVMEASGTKVEDVNESGLGYGARVGANLIGMAANKAINVIGEGAYGVFGEGLRGTGGGIRDGFDEWAQSIDSLAAEVAKDWSFKTGNFDEIGRIDEARKKGEKVLEGNLPEIDLPKTPMGMLIHDVAQFATGSAVAGKLFKGVGWTTQGFKRLMAQGALSDAFFFDPQAKRIANIMDGWSPEQRGHFVNFMRADPEHEGEWEARGKRMLEGMGLSAAQAGLFWAGAKGWKYLAKFRGSVDDYQPTAAPHDFSRLGDPAAPHMATTDYVPKTNKYGTVNLNFAATNSDADIAKSVKEVVGRFAKNESDPQGPIHIKAEKARVGESAAFDELLKVRANDKTLAPLTTAETKGLSTLFFSAGRKVMEMAHHLNATDTAANAFGLRKAQAIHNAFRELTSNGQLSKDTVDELAHWTVPKTGTPKEQVAAITQALDRAGGQRATKAMAVKIVDHMARGRMNVTKLGKLSEKVARSTTLDALTHAYTASLLWNPGTQSINVLSNAAFMFTRMGERGLASMFPRPAEASGHVEPGEAMKMLGATGDAFRDTLSFAYKYGMSKVTGKPAGPVPDVLKNAFDTVRTGKSITGTAQSEGKSNALVRWSQRAVIFKPNTPTGKAMQALGNIWGGSHTALQFSDELFKSIIYKQELSALAHRRVQQELREGHIGSGDTARRYEELKLNPSNEMHDAAMEEARYGTFQQAPGKFTRGIMETANQYPALRILVMPFINTPSNLMKAAIERTPAGLLMKKVQDDLLAGGARADMAAARMTLGTLNMGFGADMVMRGEMTGAAPSNPAEIALWQRLGIRPYSIKVGDHWVPYNRFDPLGFQLALIANLTHATAQSTWDETDQEDHAEAWANIGAMMGGTVLSSSYMDKTAQLADIMHESLKGKDKMSVIGGGIEAYLGGIAGGFVPSIFSTIEQSIDPRQRVAQDTTVKNFNDFVGRVKIKMPYFNEALPVDHDLWGREKLRGTGGVFNWMNPFIPYDPQPIDKELDSLHAFIAEPGYGFQLTPSETRRYIGDRARGFSPQVDLRQRKEIYQRWKVIAGQETMLPKYGNRTMLDTVNAVVDGSGGQLSRKYQRLAADPKGGSDSKIAFLREIIGDYRSASKRQLIEEFPELEGALHETVNERNRKYR